MVIGGTIDGLHRLLLPVQTLVYDMWCVHVYAQMQQDAPQPWPALRQPQPCTPHGAHTAWRSHRIARTPHGAHTAWRAHRMARTPHGAHTAWRAHRMGN